MFGLKRSVNCSLDRNQVLSNITEHYLKKIQQQAFQCIRCYISTSHVEQKSLNMLNMWTVLEKVVPFLIEQLKKKRKAKRTAIFFFFRGQPMHDCLHITVHLHKELCNSGTVSLQEPQ